MTQQELLKLVENIGNEARSLAVEIPHLLDGSPTVDQLKRAFAMLDRYVDQAGNLIEYLDENDAHQEIVDAAQQVEDIIFEMQKAVTARILEIGGNI